MSGGINKPVEGRILCSNGGFYYVEVAIGDAREVLECRARGLFRKQKLTPLVGDIAVVEPTVEPGKGFVVEIRPRRNQLIRPPVANVDQLLLVIAVADPAPVPLVIDQMIAIAEKNGIEPIVVVNKSDLGDTGRWEAIYKAAGLRVEALSALDVQGVQPLRALLSGRISAFTGNSGVGKSSLLNALYPDLELATGEISRKLGRGRHTTRTVTLYSLPEGGYIADTPGFSTLDLQRAQPLQKEELAGCFREFAPYLGGCRFTSCAHVKEADCAVRRAVEEGKIPSSRYASYVTLYEQIKDIPSWSRK